MRALVVYCHPNEDSFNASVRDLVLKKLAAHAAETRVCDLYKRGFDPVLTKNELNMYLDCPANQATVAQDVADIRWCDTLIFVYPTWWYGMPAMLKGWLDRVLLPDVAFSMPDIRSDAIRPGLTHITRLAVFTTCGASRWLTWMIGAPGRRILLRGVRLLCAKKCKTTFAAHYLMDRSTHESRMRHLSKVARILDRFLGYRDPAKLRLTV